MGEAVAKPDGRRERIGAVGSAAGVLSSARTREACTPRHRFERIAPGRDGPPWDRRRPGGPRQLLRLSLRIGRQRTWRSASASTCPRRAGARSKGATARRCGASSVASARWASRTSSLTAIAGSSRAALSRGRAAHPRASKRYRVGRGRVEPLPDRVAVGSTSPVASIWQGGSSRRTWRLQDARCGDRLSSRDGPPARGDTAGVITMGWHATGATSRARGRDQRGWHSVEAMNLPRYQENEEVGAALAKPA